MKRNVAFSIKFKSKSGNYYLIPFFGFSGGLLGLLLSFDDVFVNGIAGMEKIYFRQNAFYLIERS